MSLSTFDQPDITVDDENAWPTKVDDAVAVHHALAGAFAAHQQDQNSPDVADLTVRIDAGAIWNVDTETRSAVAAQNTSALTAPSTNPRKDIVYLDETTGAVGVATGTEDVSPVDPAVPAGKFPVARINWTVGMTEITNADLDDLRVAFPTGWLKPDGDGSSLTGLSVGDQVARDMAAAALAYGMAQNDAASIIGGVGVFHLSDDFETDSLAIKTNATYDASGDYYGNPGSSVKITGGTASGDYTTHGGNAAAFDGVTNQSYLAGAANLSGDGILGLDHGGGVTKEIVEMRLYAANNSPFTGGGSGFTYALVGSNSVFGSGGSTLLSDTVTAGEDVTSAVITTTSGITGGSYRYHWVDFISGGAAYVVEVEFYEASAPANITLAPTAATLATANPTDLLAYVIIDPVDSITVGTDIVMTMSIDGGTTDATGTWTKVGDIGSTGEELYRVEADVSAQTGSSLTYEITTANNKEIRYHDCVGIVAIY